MHTGIDEAAIAALLDRRSLLLGNDQQLTQTVAAIIERVRTAGDEALIAYAQAFDGVMLRPGQLRLSLSEIEAGAAATPLELRRALEHAAGNIRRFHELQRRPDLRQVDEDGSILELRFVPLQRVGVYVPGGTGGLTPLISSVLMNIIPAQVAGVRSIAVCSPPCANGALAPGLLAALSLLGVEEVYRTGGAQAIAAMAYGTETIPAVAKVAGPGNRYVAEAKRQVFGQVGIDMLAGPSEVAIIADGQADPRLVAADLLAQAEHDPAAGAILFTPAESLAQAVSLALAEELCQLSRADLAERSLGEHGGAIVTKDLEEAAALAEILAPEHLELLIAEPRALADRVRTAGAIFLGVHSPEALGDYVAGTNHVLPTNGTARFASGLGVDDFLRRVSLVEYSAAGYAANAPQGIILAEAEGLTAHAYSLACRGLRRTKRDE